MSKLPFGVQVGDANMELINYIRKVVEANSLQRIANYLLESSDSAYHADSHVDAPPQGLGVEAACSAGLALLREWTQEAAFLGPFGLVATPPLLVIDQEWLDELPDAPHPHVLVTLAKNAAALPSGELNAKPSSKADCPLGRLLSGELETVSVFRVEASDERESLGGWLFRFDAQPTPDS
jgi:hypothetical protein